MKQIAVLAVVFSIAVVLAAGGSAFAGEHHGHWFKHACAAPSGRVASCHAQVVTDSAGIPLVTNASPPSGAYGPSQFHGGYSLPTTAPTVQTIGIVDAYDDPNIEADLASYSAQYGLPACTTANGCFRKVNQNGGTSYPPSDAGWALEIALDVETAHAICQNCQILLVEASSAFLTDLGAAENRAVALGANVVSNSWGAGEYSSETADDTKYFNHPGVPITVSSGDGGYGVEYPAASQYVTAVGGTTLNLNAGNAWQSETAWSGAGSGCSAFEPKPAWQTDPSCGKRTVADVSADADPNTGAAVYDSVPYQGSSGWFQVGGTSLAAPLVASVYALTGNASSVNYGSAPYSHASSLHDITSGSNGSCGGSYLCTAISGYDGPTGLGTPNGLAAFTAGAPTPDFSLGVSPSTATVMRGTNASYTVSVGSLNGFSGSVALSQAGLSGGAVTFTPASVSAPGSSTLTVTTGALAAGTYPFTITGTNGSTTHSVPATLTVQSATQPDFAIAVSPSSRTIGRTSTTTYAVTITPTNGFNGAVSLSASGFVTGLSGSFSPNPTSSTSTFTVTASGLRKHTQVTLTITGTSGSLTHSTTLRLST